MAQLRLDNLHIKYGDFHAVKGVNVEVKDSEILSLLGPSGCGKTSILRAIAGFIDPVAGSIYVDGEDITDIPAQKRHMGMIFQNYALWPHMSVTDNIGYGLKIRDVPREQREKQVKALIKQVQLEGHEDKFPGQLSGGQQQRVSLARGLAIEPKVLLCDEPLSNLDFKLRVELRTEIRRIAKDFGVTVVYVTHDQTEALAISDKIAVINSGELIQSAAPKTIYSDPNSHFVGRFVGENNLVEGTISGIQKNSAEITLKSGEKIINQAKDAENIPEVGQPVRLIVRQDRLQLVKNGGDGILTGKLNYQAFMGNFIQIEVALADGTNVMANIHTDEAELLDDVTRGDPINLALDPDCAYLFSKEGMRI